VYWLRALWTLWTVLGGKSEGEIWYPHSKHDLRLWKVASEHAVDVAVAFPPERIADTWLSSAEHTESH
jgi:hypothetical protein